MLLLNWSVVEFWWVTHTWLVVMCKLVYLIVEYSTHPSIWLLLRVIIRVLLLCSLECRLFYVGVLILSLSVCWATIDWTLIALAFNKRLCSDRSCGLVWDSIACQSVRFRHVIDDNVQPLVSILFVCLLLAVCKADPFIFWDIRIIISPLDNTHRWISILEHLSSSLSFNTLWLKATIHWKHSISTAFILLGNLLDKIWSLNIVWGTWFHCHGDNDDDN